MEKSLEKGFMTMSKKLIIFTPNHPLSDQFKNLQSDYDIVALDSIELKEKLKTHNTVFDLCCLETKDKITLLKTLSHHKVYTDLSVNKVNSLITDFPQIKGAFSLAIFGGTNARECFINNEGPEELEAFLSHFSLTPFIHKSAPDYFILGRTIAPIINEAYFAIQEDLASKEDIDNAMKYGVNYPIGPFEWSNLFGKDKVGMLLNELYLNTKQDRYIPCTLLS